MLDLKAKLLQAGLVTEDQVEKVEKEQAEAQERRRKQREQRAKGGPKGKGGPRGGPRKGGPKGKEGGPRGKGAPKGPPRAPESDADRWKKRVAKLKEAGKSEQYDAIRGWVERTRLDDPKAMLSENAERYHFPKGDGAISWLSVEPELHGKLKEGKAGIVGYMSFNGLMFCAVPREVALDIAEVRPEWLRALADHEFEALAIEAPRKRPKKKKGEGDAEGAETVTADVEAAEPATAEAVTADAVVADAPVDDIPAAQTPVVPESPEPPLSPESAEG